MLLYDALNRASTTSDEIAALAVVVDAKDDRARAFYERYGFERFEDDHYRLYLPIASVAALDLGR